MCRLLMCSLLRCARWGLFLPLLLLLAPVTSWASETPQEAYTVTAAELQQLDSNLTRLQELNSELRQTSGTLRNQLVDCQTELAQAREQLTAAEKQSRELRDQLTALTEKSMSQDALLTRASESLKEFSAEQKRTRLRIKAQRHAWQVVAGLLVVGLAVQ